MAYGGVLVFNHIIPKWPKGSYKDIVGFVSLSIANVREIGVNLMIHDT